MAATSTSSAQRLNILRLPNEVKDMIFAYLGWEVNAFVMSRETSSSALKALWPVFCREISASNGKAINFDSLTTVAYNRLLSRTHHMLTALSSTPELASTVSRVTFTAPVYVKTTHTSHGQSHSSVHIDSTGVWHNLLLRLHKVRELRLVALPPRRAKKRSRIAEPPMSGRIPMPLSVKKLYIEDVWVCSCGNEDDHDLQDGCEVSSIASLFGECQDIESLHVNTPVLTREQAEHIRRFECLKEFRADVEGISESVTIEGFMELLEDMGSLTQLITFDLRYSWVEHWAGESPLPDDWMACLPNIRTLRMPLAVFFPAFVTEFESMGPTPLKIELLFDHEGAAREMIESVTKMQKPEASKLHYTRVQPALSTPWARQRLHAIKSAMSLVERANNLLQLRQKMGEIEMRKLTLIECDWAEDGVGPAWFANSYDENDFMRAFNQVVCNEEGAREGLVSYDFGMDSEGGSQAEPNDDYEQESEDEESEEDESEGEAESGDEKDDNEGSDEWSDREDDEETDEDADEDSTGEEDEESDEEDGEDGDE